MSVAVGIDLGTTFSVVARVDAAGVPRVIPNDQGRPTSPSTVYYGLGGPIVGDEARERQAVGEAEVASFFKRSMGDPNFAVGAAGTSYSPTRLSSLVLAYLKRCAEARLGEPVTHAVISVPADFNNMQREATIEAGRLAGLEVLSIISEPTAAALSYGLRPSDQTRTVLVYDLGGGTFDVSLVRISPDELRVIGTDGDHNLGGKDWDDRLLRLLDQRFREEQGIELLGDDVQELLVAAENLKKSLSARETAEIRLQAGGRSGRFQVSRAQFERSTTDLLERTQRLTERVLEEAGLTWANLDGVLPVGGSTRMPMVREWIVRMSGQPPLGGVNPDEAVALGAALQADEDLRALQPHRPSFGLPSRRAMVDVMSHSLGMIATNNDNSRYVNSILIQKNQPIPSVQTRPYQLQVGLGRDNLLDVFLTQGESDDPAKCAYLGRYVFSGLEARQSGTCVIDVTYAYDRSGVVRVSARGRGENRDLVLTTEPVPDDVPARFAEPPRGQTREPLTVYLAFDLSGSMSGQPLREAQKAASAFMTQCDLTTTSIGLISFSDRVQVSLRASQNAAEIQRAIGHLSIGATGNGNDGDPFDQVHDLLRDVRGSRYALVLADGVWSHQDQAVQRARRCHQAGVQVIAIGFGGADRRFLEQISSSTEQSFFTDMNKLAETFGSIAQELTSSGGIAMKSDRGSLRRPG